MATESIQDRSSSSIAKWNVPKHPVVEQGRSSPSAQKHHLEPAHRHWEVLDDNSRASANDPIRDCSASVVRQWNLAWMVWVRYLDLLSRDLARVEFHHG